VAVALKLSEDKEEILDAKIALTVAAPTPVRATLAEDFLKGNPVKEEIFKEAGRIASSPDCCTPRTSLRCEAWYREDMVRVLVPRMAEKAAERAGKSRQRRGR
jgi:CO/xanthine dehydrogenase FAD-binding subunit